jgi:hypothetical protein
MHRDQRIERFVRDFTGHWDSRGDRSTQTLGFLLKMDLELFLREELAIEQARVIEKLKRALY